MSEAAWPLERVLLDLERWRFGALLASRAGWACEDAGAVDQAVQAFRRRILEACRKQAGQAESPLQGDPGAWEDLLVTEFLEALQALAPLGGAELKLTRFAHGQYFKYSRRVALLLRLEQRLPCAYAPL